MKHNMKIKLLIFQIQIIFCPEWGYVDLDL